MSEVKRNERTTVTPMTKAPASWRPSVRFLRDLLSTHDLDEKVIDIPEVRGEVVSYFSEETADAFIVHDYEEIVEGDEHA